MTTYLDLFHYRELFGSLFRRDLRAKYKGSVLGLAWSLAHPVILMLVYLLVWVFFATSLQSAARSLLENANLIRKVRFPRQLVPLSMVATQLVGFAVMLVIVIVLSLVYISEARDTVWLAIPMAALAVCLVAGFALAVSSLNALYRDVEHIVAALLLPWFFLTPVLYSLENIPGVAEHPRLVDLIHYGNPLTPAVEAVRDPIFFGEPPATVDAIYLAIAAVLSLALGAYVFSRVDDRVAVEV